MDKDERRTITAVQMEISDMVEKLDALDDYLINFLNSERKNDEEKQNTEN